MPDGGATAYILAAASIAATAVGTGVSYYSQQEQSRNAAAMANYNRQVADQNNRVNLQLAQQQSSWQAQNAEARAAAQNNNATALERQGRAAESQAREEARRERIKNERQLSMQRARYGKSGVTSEGSPLAVMAETAGLLELGIQDINYRGDMEGRAYDRKADLERFEAGFSMFDAGIARYEGAAAEAGFSINQNKSQADYLSGMNTAAGYKSAATGTLIQGVGSAINTGASSYSSYSRTPRYSNNG